MSSSTSSSLHNPVGRLAAEHPGLVKAGRAGWLAKGVVYVIAGVLALVLAGKAAGWSTAASAPNQEASPNGALKTVAEASGGKVLLWLLAIGMILYALVAAGVGGAPGDSDAETWAKRCRLRRQRGDLRQLRDHGDLAGAEQADELERQLQGDGHVRADHGAHRGRVLIGIVGAIVIAVGLYRIGKGLKTDVNDELDLGGLPAPRRRVVERLGAVGEIGAASASAWSGSSCCRAAINYRQDEATGLDGALRRLATETWGLILVIVVGIGFVAYGVFCASTFHRRRLEGP